MSKKRKTIDYEIEMKKDNSVCLDGMNVVEINRRIAEVREQYAYEWEGFYCVPQFLFGCKLIGRRYLTKKEQEKEDSKEERKEMYYRLKKEFEPEKHEIKTK